MSKTIEVLRLGEIAGKLRTGELDLRRHVEELLDRVDRVEERLQALVPEPGRRERLLEEAAALLERFPRPEGRPPLFGVVTGVKDIFRVDGFPTRAGAQLPPELFAGPEARCVSALRRAGCLVLGKTVTAELAYFEPGPTRNPHDLRRTPGGSSSGSGAAVAAGYCPLALGTQTVGSVIRPAAFCGVVGFKPSYGRIDAEGLVFYSPSVDTVGMFAQDVAGMRQAAGVVCREWKGVGRGRRPVLGIPEGPYLEQAEVEGLAGFAEQVRGLEAAGYAIRRVPALEDIEPVNQRHRQLITGEVAREHAGWFAAYGDRCRPRTAAIIREGQLIGDAEIETARAGRFELRAKLEQAMQGNGIDAWICPAAPGPAPEGIQTTGDPVMNLPWTHAGLPALSLPAGRTRNGLPLGLQCVAGFMRDEELLAWGECLERDLRWETKSMMTKKGVA